MPNISIVIPTMNRTSLLERCLSSISRETGTGSDIEIIVVDDGSHADVAVNNRLVCNQHHAIFIHPGANHGMAVARNYGIAAADGEWIVFLDDDVAVDPGWYRQLCDTLQQLPDDTVGFEGRINPSGNGVWDHEVSNMTGGAFLTSHLGMRKVIVDKCGGFDAAFEFKGPFCEDHELAARALQWGKVPFIPSLSVTHAPRSVNLLHFLITAPRRCRGLLLAEHYFYNKHPDRYHCFRSHRTFLGTLRSVLLRNIINDLRRRSLRTLLRHPLQTAALLLGSLIEQVTAWALLPRFLRGYLSSSPRATFRSFVDVSRTATHWHISGDAVEKLRIGRSILLALLFPFIRRPAYNAVPTLSQLKQYTSGRQCKLYLRIDDMYLHDEDAIRRLCDLMKKHNCPFLAAVTGDDLCNNAYRQSVNLIRNAGGTIGIHGFSHSGKFGPFPSELLQMQYPVILAKIDAIRQTGLFENDHPLILVPPFNAIGPGQIVYLSRLFRVICGGPETMRFTDRILGPVAICEGGWYFPSLHPFYGSAQDILRSGLIKRLLRISGSVCMTMHLTCEASDSFQSLSRLLASLPTNPHPWNRLF